MEILNVNDRKASKIESYPYRGRRLQVKEVWTKWLSQAGPKGAPEYGVRFFTIGPGGEIPIHNHLYYQTMYILSGRLACVAYDRNSDQLLEERILGPHPRLRIHSYNGAAQHEELERHGGSYIPVLHRQRLRGRSI